jgi:hypothetical protein
MQSLNLAGTFEPRRTPQPKEEINDAIAMVSAIRRTGSRRRRLWDARRDDHNHRRRRDHDHHSRSFHHYQCRTCL